MTIMKLAADGGLGTVGVKIPPAESSTEIFEQRKQAGMDQLRETIAKAFEGVSADQAIDHIFSLARDRAEAVKANLQELQESIRDEGDESLRISLGEGVQEAIQGLDQDMQHRIREAVTAFETNMVAAVRASVVRDSAEPSSSLSSEGQETAEQKIIRLQKEVADLKTKQQKRSEKTGVGPLIREGHRLKVLQEEIHSLTGQGGAEAVSMVSSAEGVSASTPLDVETVSSPDPKAEKRAKLVAQLETLKKDLAASEKARGGKGKPGIKEALLAIRVGQVESDLTRLEAEGVSAPPPPQEVTSGTKSVVSGVDASAASAPTPDSVSGLASPDAQPVPSPDVPKLSGFQERVAVDERRLEKIKGLVDGWIDPATKGEPALKQDGAIRAFVDWYGKLIAAERALADAPVAEKSAKRKEIDGVLSVTPRGEESLEGLQKLFERFLSEKSQAKYSPEWKQILESRKAVLDVLNESLTARVERAKAKAESSKSPDPVVPAPVTSPSSPDAGLGVAPDATKKSVFEDRVASDEERLNKMDGLIKGWSAAETTAEDANVKALANWYNEVHEADQALVAAADQKVRGRALDEIARRMKRQPAGDASLEQVRSRLDALLAAATTDEQKKPIESRLAVLALIDEGRKAQGLKGKNVSEVPKPVPPAPDVPAPSGDAALPDPEPVVPHGPEYGPKTLQEAFEREDALFRRLTTLLGNIEPSSEIDDAPLQEFVARLAESLSVFEKIVKSTDADEQLSLSAERTRILERGDVRLQTQAYAETLQEAMDGMSLEEIASEPGIAKRIEVLESLAEVFPSMVEYIPPLKSKLESASRAKPIEGSGDSLEALLARDGALIRTLEKLTLASSNIEMLDDPDEGQSSGELDRVLLGVQRAFDFLQTAAEETDPKRRRELLIQRQAVLEDPNLKASAQTYLKNMAVMLRGVDPDALKEDTEMDTRIKIMEALTQLFPDLVADVETFKGEKRNAELLPFEQRTHWQAFAAEKGKQHEQLRKALEEAKNDPWYASNKGSIEAGLAFQEGLVQRVQRLLDAKTLEERQAADRALVEFRRTVFSLKPLVPDWSREKAEEALEKVRAEIDEIKASDQEKAKRKAAIEEKQKAAEPWERLLGVLQLQDVLTKEAMLHSMPTEEELHERQKRARQENFHKTNGEKRAPESVEGVVKGMQEHSERQSEERVQGVKIARETQELFSETLTTYEPYPETKKLFSPIYEQWEKEQVASLTLLDTERKYNFLDYLEMGATQSLRSLDRVSEGSLDEERIREMWQSFPGVIRKLFVHGEDEEVFVQSFVSGKQNIEGLKASLYETLRRVTQDKVRVGQDMEKALQEVGSLDGSTERLVASKKEQLQVELETLEQTYQAALVERQQKSPGGQRYNDVRWRNESARLEYAVIDLAGQRTRLQSYIKDLDGLEELLDGRRRVDDPSALDATVAFELRRVPNEKMMEIMKSQVDRKALFLQEEEVRAKIVRSNPSILAKGAVNSSGPKPAGEAKENKAGGGKVAESVLEGNWGWKKIKESLKMLWPFGS